MYFVLIGYFRIVLIILLIIYSNNSEAAIYKANLTSTNQKKNERSKFLKIESLNIYIKVVLVLGLLKTFSYLRYEFCLSLSLIQ